MHTHPGHLSLFVVARVQDSARSKRDKLPGRGHRANDDKRGTGRQQQQGFDRAHQRRAAFACMHAWIIDCMQLLVFLGSYSYLARVYYCLVGIQCNVPLCVAAGRSSPP
jgi:hypothetical protein